MKKSFLLLLYLILMNILFAQPEFELSRNVYRIPYASATKVRIGGDHYSHDPRGRYDMKGIEGEYGSCNESGYRIVAAAAGIVRRIVDSHDVHGGDCDRDVDPCDYAKYNNYIWIEHANGEWSKYTHMMKNSISVAAGLSVGDTICAGTFLGYECDIGRATGPHLHFEVRFPLDTNNIDIDVDGGGMSNADHRIPVINTASIHYFSDNDEWTASASGYCPPAVVVPGMLVPNRAIQIYIASDRLNTDDHSISYEPGSNGLFQAVNTVTIKPGFQAKPGSYFVARIRSCGTTPFPGGCN